LIKSLAHLALFDVVVAGHETGLVLEPTGRNQVAFAVDVIGPNQLFNCVAKEDFSMVCTTPSGESLDGKGYNHVELD
jgi:hypothetical protein